MNKPTNVLWFVKPEDCCTCCRKAVTKNTPSVRTGIGRSHETCWVPGSNHKAPTNWMVDDIIAKKKETT